MALSVTALEVVLDGALGLWLGSIAFFSFVGAPTTFRVLDDEYAGKVVNAIFPTYYLLGAAAGVVAFLAGVGIGQLDDYDLALGVVFLGAIVGAGLDLYARQILIPKMDAAGDRGFERYHRRSVILNAVTLGAVALAFVAAHL